MRSYLLYLAVCVTVLAPASSSLLAQPSRELAQKLLAKPERPKRPELPPSSVPLKFLKGIMRKHRGLKRYYKNLQTKEEDWSGLNFTDPDKAWFDLWHTHFDWHGYGNDSFKRRKPHLDKLFREFDVLEKKAKLLKTEFQIWATLLDFESYDDALFLHPPNPNQNNFPHKLKDLSTKNNLKNKALAEYVNNLTVTKSYSDRQTKIIVLFIKTMLGLCMT